MKEKDKVLATINDFINEIQNKLNNRIYELDDILIEICEFTKSIEFNAETRKVIEELIKSNETETKSKQILKIMLSYWEACEEERRVMS